MSEKRAAIGMELDELSQNTGRLLPEAVVARAADQTSAMHDQFEWDDTEAARLHRLNTARQLIRIYIKFAPSIQRNVRAYLSLPSDRADGDGYRQTENVLGNPMQRQEMIDDALKRLARFRDSYHFLPELDNLWARVDEMIASFRLALSTRGGVA